MASHKSEREPKEMQFHSTVQGRVSLCPNSSDTEEAENLEPKNVAEGLAENGLERSWKAPGLYLAEMFHIRLDLALNYTNELHLQKQGNFFPAS